MSNSIEELFLTSAFNRVRETLSDSGLPVRAKANATSIFVSGQNNSPPVQCSKDTITFNSTFAGSLSAEEAEVIIHAKLLELTFKNFSSMVNFKFEYHIKQFFIAAMNQDTFRVQGHRKALEKGLSRLPTFLNEIDPPAHESQQEKTNDQG